MYPMDIWKQEEAMKEFEEQNKKNWWKNLLGTIIVVLCIFTTMWLAGAFQEHYECLNGRTEVCIPEDFE